MNKRDMLIARIRTAGYHQDQRTMIRIYVESRNISQATAQRAFSEGARLRAAGMACSCTQCITPRPA
jgi:hypothetical protein